MPQKSKCSPEEKVKAVENYLNGTKSQGQILQTHRIDKATLRSWVCLYKSAEKEGLTPQAVNKHYPVKRKEQVVTEYLAGEKAYLSAILDLKDRSIVSHVLGHNNNNPLVFQTINQAMALNPNAQPLLHSDRRFQYTSKVFKTKLGLV